MRKIVILTVMLMVLMSCVKLPVYESIEHKSSKEGHLTNGNICKYFDVDSKMRYGFDNDEANVYFRFLFIGNQNIMKMRKSGLKIYIDTTAKKKKKDYINYPLAMNREVAQGNSGEMKGNRGGNKRGKPDLMRLITFIPPHAKLVRGEKTIEFNAKEDSTIKIVLSEVEGKLLYELKVPLKVFGIDYERYKTQAFSVGFHIDGLEMQAPSGGGDTRGGMSGGGGGGQSRPGGSSSPRGEQGGSADMQSLMQATDLWFSVMLK